MPYTSDAFRPPNIASVPVCDIFEDFTVPFLNLIKTLAMAFTMLLKFYIPPLYFGLKLIAWASKSVARSLRPQEFYSEAFNCREAIMKVTLRLMSRSGMKAIQKTWWLYYYAFATVDDFETNYLDAWQELLSTKKRVRIFVGSDSLLIPIGSDSDTGTLRLLQMWYKCMQLKRGLPETVLPKAIVRVDKVEVKNSLALGVFLETLPLGRSGHREAYLFENPGKAEGLSLTDQIQNLTDSEGLEFVREWDKTKISMVVLTPAVISLMFISIWIPVFLHFGQDSQAVVSTALTTGSYVVTVGALIIALFAYLDYENRPGKAYKPLNSGAAGIA